MIAIVGSRGYVGQAFCQYFENNNLDYFRIGRAETSQSPEEIAAILRKKGADFLVNAAGFTGKPNVDACELQKHECLQGNAVLPGIISEAATVAGITWGHVSSGCIFNGSANGQDGFDETMTPNFSFRSGNCSFYSGTKALGEEVLENDSNCYIWRLRIPFNEIDNKRNYISKLIRYPKLLQATNSLSHLGDYVASCVKCINSDVPKGIYNLTNPGSISTREVVDMIIEAGVCNKEFQFFKDEDEFMREAAKTPRSNCVLDTAKAAAAGIKMRSLREALIDSLGNWK